MKIRLLLRHTYIYIIVCGVLFLMCAASYGESERVLLRDPFQRMTPHFESATEVESPTDNVSQKGSFILQGIWKSGYRYKAMISGKIVSVKDTLDQYVVSQIFSDKVVMKGKHSIQSLTLRMLEKESHNDY